jgi:hypothetical protein
MHQGVSHMRNPQELTHVGWSYAVLAVAFVSEFYSWRIFYWELLSRKDPDESTWDDHRQQRPDGLYDFPGRLWAWWGPSWHFSEFSLGMYSIGPISTR